MKALVTRTIRGYPSIFLIILFIISFRPCNTQAQQINTAKLDSFFNVLSENNKLMGSFMISKNGKTIYSKTIGYSQIEGTNKIPATSETQYRIGSITKTFTAAMIFQLIDENKLIINSKIGQFKIAKGDQFAMFYQL